MAGERDGAVLAEPGHIVKGRRRVFDVGNVERLEPRQRPAGCVERPGVVGVQAQCCIRPDRGADLLYHLNLGIQI